MPIHAGGKGKERAAEIDSRDEGAGGTSGIVLSLEQVGTGVSDVAYTLPVKVGATNQEFSLQIDTGSSDLWIASTSCYTSSCSQSNGHLYDPSEAIATGVNFSIPYLSGSAAGPIVWDSVSIGGYTVDHQALAAVTDVQNEPLSSHFSGVLGLALPSNSIIAADVAPVTSGSDGAVWASNLFSETPPNTTPSSPFLSLALSRPGSDQVPAVLGIGRHPATLIPDPSLIRYSTLVSDKPGGPLFWKAAVRGITVYVNGVANPVELGFSNTGAAFPSAVLDSGTPRILTTTTIANAIYGSIGITPANDGMYYVPCTTPLNMTITLDDRPETPLHPLDLTAEPPQENQAQFCTGLIQTADLTNPTTSQADIILGVPFMRNVYTVMAYSVPDSNGSFTAANSDDRKDGGLSQTTTLRLGLLPLTDPTKALEEFHNVRVLNLPIGGGLPTNGNGSASPTVNVGGRKLSVGIVILIALSSFFAFCGVMFAIRWFIFRHKHRQAATRGVYQAAYDDPGMDKVAYMLTRTSPSKREKAIGLDNHGGLSEDELRKMRFEAYIHKEKILSDSTMNSDRTRVGVYEGGDYGKVYDDTEGREFGMRNPITRVQEDEDLVWDPATGLDWGDNNTLTQHPPRAYEIPPETPETDHAQLTPSHLRKSSLARAMQPLLSPPSQRENDFDVDEYGGYTRYPSLNTSK
ncbi:acid protease [Phlegmacium glaucopus]|nr:acid protease [Phlegmacium glaucopus]